MRRGDCRRCSLLQGSRRERNARQFARDNTLGHARAAHHPRTARPVFADDIDRAVNRCGEYGISVIGVEIYDVLIRCKMLLNIGVENTEAAVNVGETAPKLLLIDRQVWQTHARNALVECTSVVCR